MQKELLPGFPEVTEVSTPKKNLQESKIISHSLGKGHLSSKVPW